MIFQYASGKIYQKMLDVTHQRHFSYAHKHNMRFHSQRGGKNVCWDKLVLMRKFIEEYEYVIYLDADMVIVNLDCDLRAACRGLSLVRHVNHYNVGAIYLDKSGVPLLDEWLSYLQVPTEGDWWTNETNEQYVINKIEKGRIVPLKHRYNWTNYCNHGEPMWVRGYHGEGFPEERLKQIENTCRV